MCLARAFSEGEELILEDISKLRIEGNKVNLRTLFGEEIEIEGFLKEIDFQGARIVIQQSA